MALSVCYDRCVQDDRFDFLRSIWSGTDHSILEQSLRLRDRLYHRKNVLSKLWRFLHWFEDGFLRAKMIYVVSSNEVAGGNKPSPSESSSVLSALSYSSCWLEIFSPPTLPLQLNLYPSSQSSPSWFLSRDPRVYWNSKVLWYRAERRWERDEKEVSLTMVKFR